MITFAMLSSLIRAFIALWALLLLLADLGNIVISAVRKRYIYTALALIICAPCYYLWQVIFDFSLFGNTEKINSAAKMLCSQPVALWLSAMAVLTLASAFLMYFNIRYDSTYITSGTIKLYLDRIPCGICCWRENGRVLFSNICMNSLCHSITGGALLNGNQFRDATKSRIITVDGKVWRFAVSELTLDGERIYEMIASNITDEYAKTQALERDKAELSRVNQELKEYYQSIDESVKHQEILQAKMNIHDEMNRLMLSTVAADKEDADSLDDIFLLWEQNAVLLCMEAENKSVAQQSEALKSLADALGINLIWKSSIPQLSEMQRELFFFTAQESVINAVKHAEAENMEISFEETENSITCFFINDGALPEKSIEFEGGLANLEILCKKQNAIIYAEVGSRFALVLKFFIE